MDPDYFEKEVKILDVDINDLVQRLESINAEKVFDDERTITYLDNEEGKIKNSGQVLKVTEEGSVKVSISTPLISMKKSKSNLKPVEKKKR